MTILLFGGLILDSLTGYLLAAGVVKEGALLSPSQIFRAFGLLLIGVHYFIRMPAPIFLVTAFFFLLLALSETLAYLRGGSDYGLVFGLTYATKLIYPMLLYFLTQSALRGWNAAARMGLLLQNYFFMCAILLIILYFLGVGEATYKTGNGFKGYFPGGNGLGLTLGIGSVWLSLVFYRKWSVLRLLAFAACATAAVLVGTKTTFIFVVLSVITLLLGCRLQMRVGVAAVLLATWSLNPEILTQRYDVVTHRFSQSSSAYAFVMSQRDIYLREAIREVSPNMTLGRLLFGGGALASFQASSSSGIEVFDTLEQDLTDIFFFYGLLGVAYYLALFSMLCSRAVASRGALFLWSLIVGHSLLAGHVLLNGQVSAVAIFAILSLAALRKSARRSDLKSAEDL